jgi:hypothetical protein
MKKMSIFEQEEKLLEVSIPNLKVTVTNRGVQGSHFCKCRIGKYGEKMGMRWKPFEIRFVKDSPYGISADSTGLICSKIKMVPNERLDKKNDWYMIMAFTITLSVPMFRTFCPGISDFLVVLLGAACGVVIGLLIHLIIVIKMMYWWEVEISNGVNENEEASVILFRVPVKSIEDEIKMRKFIGEFDKIKAELKLDYDTKSKTMCD